MWLRNFLLQVRLKLRHRRTSKSSKEILSEDLLKALYHAPESSDDHDQLECLRKQCGIPPEKLPEVIGQLVLDKAIETNPLRLTASGKKRALTLLRSHRIYERYLSERSGFAPEEWHSKAEEMEHQLNAEEKTHIARLLHNPLWDPHGDPIPTEQLHIPKASAVSCPVLESGRWYRILHIEDDNEATFRYVMSLGLARGGIIQVEKKSKDWVMIRFEGEEYQVPLPVFGEINLALLEEDSSEVSDAQGLIRLTRLNPDETAVIAALSPACFGAMRRRLMDLGFVKGSRISIDMCSPLGNPTAYVVRQTAIALRADQARYILVRRR